MNKYFTFWENDQILARAPLTNTSQLFETISILHFWDKISQILN